MTSGATTAGAVALPVLVRGRLVVADPDAGRDPDAGHDAGAGGRVHVVRQPVIDRGTLRPTGEERVLVLPRPDPRELLVDRGPAVEELMGLPFEEVLAFAAELGRQLGEAGDDVAAALDASGPAATVDARATRIAGAQLAELFAHERLGEAVDRDLGSGDAPGRAFLDGWVTLPTPARRGPTALLADRLHGRDGPPHLAAAPRLRAVPTHQLHVTAGNSPLVVAVSLLWALATKGAAVVKAPVGTVAVSSAIASAMARVDPDHPLCRHTSIVYWPGGDPSVEDVLLGSGRFDRLVAWGSADAVTSLRARAGSARTIAFGPRASVSLIGREALAGDLAGVAARAAADSVVADQAVCQASLLHVVEGPEDDALAYCEALQAALAEWDRALPHVLGPETVGHLRHLRRGALADGTWFDNGRWPALTSTVVLAPGGFDLARHPGGRCVVVRRVDHLVDGLRLLDPGIMSVGVAPDDAREALAAPILARGADGVLPLGEAEARWAGMPHDGLRVLGELVRWVSG